MNKKKPIWHEYLAACIVGLLLVALAPILICIYIVYVIHGHVLFLLWNIKHGLRGRRFLVVFSSSPKWEQFFEERVVPLVMGKAFIVNITKDQKWKGSRSIERRAHKYWGGYEEHTPIVLYFPHFGKVKVLRFYKAFVSQKEGTQILNEHLCKLTQLAKSG